MNQAYLEQLGRELGFTLAELETNQRGFIHPAQVARGRRRGLLAAAILCTLGALTLGGGGFAASGLFEPGLSRVDRNGLYAIAAASVVLAFIFLFCAGKSVVQRRARIAAFERGQVHVVEGPLNKTCIRGRGGVPSQFICRVGGRSFHTSEKLWELVTQGATYRFYLVAEHILSLAPAPHPHAPLAGTDHSGNHDPVQRATYEREMDHFARTRDIKPSRLVE